MYQSCQQPVCGEEQHQLFLVSLYLHNDDAAVSSFLPATRRLHRVYLDPHAVLTSCAEILAGLRR